VLAQRAVQCCATRSVILLFCNMLCFLRNAREQVAQRAV
ncbi:hypothetical protein A2U01_0079043, partial [Trifolium medium]|nr:hypothetical protein [Trifolium medium]